MNRRSWARRAVGPALICVLAGLLSPIAAGAMIEESLPNGLRLLYEERPASGLVATAVLVGAGAAHETAANNGAAHFLEHLLFDGTDSRTQAQLEHDTELIGAYSNATTQRDHVAYLMVAGSEDLERALAIQADMLLHSTLPPDQFEKERGIIREEIAKDTSDADFAAEQVLSQLLTGSADRALPVLGTPASIAALSRDQVLDYYRRYYVPGNMTLIVLGELAPDKLRAMVERHFGRAPAGAASNAVRNAPPDSAPTGIFLRPVDADRRFVRLRLPAGAPATAPLPALLLVEELLNGESGALARALHAEPRIEGAAASAALRLDAGQSWLEVSADCDTTTQIEAVAGRLLGALQALAEGVDPVDLAAARSRREVAAALAADEIHYVAFTRADWIRHAPPAVWSNEAEALAAVTEQGITDAAAGLLAGKNAVLAGVGPGLPIKDEARNPLAELPSPAVGGADTARVARRSGAEGGREPFSLPDVPWKPVSARRAPVERRFPNGLTAIVAAAPESEVFAIELLARGRTFCEPSSKSGVADLLHRMLLHGAGGMSEEALGRELDLAGIRLKLTDDPRIPYDDYQTTQSSSFIRLETVDQYGREAIHLLSEMMQAPDLSAAFSEVKRQALLEAERRAASPVDQSQMLLRQQLFGTSPGARPALGTVADLRGMTVDDVRAFHAQYFAPSNLILAVVTGIEPEAVLAHIGALMGGEPGGAGPTVVPPARCAQPSAMQPPATHAPSRREQLMAKDQSWIRLGTVLAPKPADIPALEVATLVLSDRMMAELRERRGLAYSVGASLARAGDRAWLAAGMGTRPDSLAAAEAGITAEIRGLGKAKITADEVTRVVKNYQGRQRMRRLTRINQAQALAFDALAGDPPGTADQALMGLGRVTPAEVQKAARAYFTPAPLVTAIAR